MKTHKKPKHPGGSGHQDRRNHHRLVLVLSTLLVSLVPECRILGSWVLPWIICLGPIGLVSLALLTWFGHNFSTFS